MKKKKTIGEAMRKTENAEKGKKYKKKIGEAMRKFNAR